MGDEGGKGRTMRPPTIWRLISVRQRIEDKVATLVHHSAVRERFQLSGWNDDCCLVTDARSPKKTARRALVRFSSDHLHFVKSTFRTENNSDVLAYKRHIKIVGLTFSHGCFCLRLYSHALLTMLLIISSTWRCRRPSDHNFPSELLRFIGLIQKLTVVTERTLAVNSLIFTSYVV